MEKKTQGLWQNNTQKNKKPKQRKKINKNITRSQREKHEKLFPYQKNIPCKIY